MKFTRIIIFILPVTVSAMAGAAEEVQCFSGALKDGSRLNAKLITQDLKDISDDSVAVSAFKLSLYENGKVYSEFAIGDVEASANLEAGLEVEFGLEDDDGRVKVRAYGTNSQGIEIAGVEDYAMTLILNDCDKYSDSFDSERCVRSVSAKWVPLKNVSCDKQT